MWATDICIRQLHDAVWGVPSIEKGTNALEKRVLHQRVALKADFFPDLFVASGNMLCRLVTLQS